MQLDSAATGSKGRLLTINGPNGIEMRHTKGVDPRMVGEAGRGLIRFAEFAGVKDRAPEVTQAATFVQLAAPTDGASFSERWSQEQPKGQTVDVAPVQSSDRVIAPDAGTQEG